MAISSRMTALIQKIEAADAKHFAGLRESAKRDTEAKTLARMQARSVAKQRAAS